MNKFISLIGGLGLGAGLMFILDPDRGRGRRAVIRDKANRALREAEDALSTATRDLGNRTGGILVEAGARLTNTPVSDTTLLARVRSKLGRATSHPRAIDVIVEGGRVILRGPVLASEVASVLSIVSKVSGVREVENLLDVHETADIAALQGPANIADERLDILQRNWSPATRLLAGTAGSALAIFGARKGGVLGTTLGTVGLGLVTRGVTNTGLTDLIGISSLQGWGGEADTGDTSNISGGAGKASGRGAGGTNPGASSGARSGANARVSAGDGASSEGGTGASGRAGAGASAKANAGAHAGTRTGANTGGANSGAEAGAIHGAAAIMKSAGAHASANEDAPTNAGANRGANTGPNPGTSAGAGQRSATSARDGNGGANRGGNAQNGRAATQQGTTSGRSTGTSGPGSRTE